MDEDQLFLRHAKPPPAGISEDLYQTIEANDFITARLAPKRRVWQAAILGIIGGATAAMMLIEAFARVCN
jgi:hypothetical protein